MEILKHAMNRGNKASTVIDTAFVEGQELTDKKQIPEAFNNHFVNIGDKLAGTVEQTDTCPIDNIAETNKVIYGSMTQGLSLTILRKNNSESTNINFRLNPNAHINSYVNNVFKHSRSTMKERHIWD